MRYAIRLLLMMTLLSSAMFAQGVTNGAITGQVSDKDGNALPGVNVMAVHTPSGTKYGVTTREDGHYNLPNLRVGGPYTVTASMLGYAKQERPNVFVQLAQTTTQDFRLVTRFAVHGDKT